ncbi:MAG: rhomboid family intramembrane serine protease [Oscillochloridaceae bacterium]|nr:rhomboid family intramembrane serine protease [Chloroflexaceae bacterium]MDW8391107.1 rhomboid family intramembrane serine protease [Oscillochloridaceae bacterium]
MTQPPDESDDLNGVLRRLQEEFGTRRFTEEPEDEDPRPSPPGSDPPLQAAGPPPPRTPVLLARRPRATWVLMAAILLMYGLSVLLSGALFQPDLRALLALGAKENSLIDAGQYWRLVSATFLHANLVHIFFNSFALYVLGPETERIYGTPRFLALYFLAGIGGSVASYLLSPAPAVGASGAIFGLIGGLGIFYFLNRAILGEFGRAQLQSMVAIAVINLIIGFSSAGVIDNWGHLGGLIVGALAALALAPRLRLDPRFSAPLLVRSAPPWGWAVAAALCIAMIALAVLLPGAR